MRSFSKATMISHDLPSLRLKSAKRPRSPLRALPSKPTISAKPWLDPLDFIPVPPRNRQHNSLSIAQTTTGCSIRPNQRSAAILSFVVQQFFWNARAHQPTATVTISRSARNLSLSDKDLSIFLQRRIQTGGPQETPAV